VTCNLWKVHIFPAAISLPLCQHYLGGLLCFAGILQKNTDRLELLSLSKRKQIERLSSATTSRARADLKSALARVKHSARPNNETIRLKKRIEREKRMEPHDGQLSPPSVPISVVEHSSAQNAPNGAINDFALRLPPPAQRAGD